MEEWILGQNQSSVSKENQDKNLSTPEPSWILLYLY